MPKQFYVNEEVELKIIELYQNDTLNGVIKSTHIGAETIKKILVKHGIKEHSREEIYNIRTNKNKQIWMSKYGVDNPNKVPEIKQKADNTILKKYGVKNISQNNLIKEKKKEKTFQNYGVFNPSQSDDVRLKIEETNLKKFGFIYPSMTNERRHKQKEKMLLEGKARALKAKDTNLKRYGVASSLQILTTQQKAKHNYYVENQYFDSLPELALYLYAKDHNENIIRLPIKFEYKFKNKKHYYFPDFEYKGELIELKNNYLYNKLFEKNTQDNAKYK